jgi:hypothetical protein
MEEWASSADRSHPLCALIEIRYTGLLSSKVVWKRQSNKGHETNQVTYIDIKQLCQILGCPLFPNSWLIDYLRFYVPLKNISLIWRRHHYRWRTAKFRPVLGAQGLWAGRDLYRATPAVTRDLGFSGLIRRTAPFSRLLRHTRGCGGSILTRILTGTLLEKQLLSCICRLNYHLPSCFFLGNYRTDIMLQIRHLANFGIVAVF